MKFAIKFLLSDLFINKTLRPINIKTGTTMNAKISFLVVCVEAMIYLLVYDFQGSTFDN